MRDDGAAVADRLMRLHTRSEWGQRSWQELANKVAALGAKTTDQTLINYHRGESSNGRPTSPSSMKVDVLIALSRIYGEPLERISPTVHRRALEEAGRIIRQADLFASYAAGDSNPPRAGEFVFPGAHGYMTDKQMRRYVVDIGQHAGIGRVTAHRLRHTGGTMVLDATGNLRLAQEFLGHRNIQHTVRYTKVLPGRLAEVVAALPV